MKKVRPSSSVEIQNVRSLQSSLQQKLVIVTKPKEGIVNETEINEWMSASVETEPKQEPKGFRRFMTQRRTFDFVDVLVLTLFVIIGASSFFVVSFVFESKSVESVEEVSRSAMFSNVAQYKEEAMRINLREPIPRRAGRFPATAFECSPRKRARSHCECDSRGGCDSGRGMGYRPDLDCVVEPLVESAPVVVRRQPIPRVIYQFVSPQEDLGRGSN